MTEIVLSCLNQHYCFLSSFSPVCLDWYVYVVFKFDQVFVRTKLNCQMFDIIKIVSHTGCSLFISIL